MQDHGERVPVPLTDWVNGQLSADVAQVIFTACEVTLPSERLCVVDLDAGDGLFAKLCLDAFKLTCRSLKRDYYDRLRYIAAAGSPEMVEQWRNSSVFAGHTDHVEARVLAAAEGLPPDVQPRVIVWIRSAARAHQSATISKAALDSTALPPSSVSGHTAANHDVLRSLSRLLTQLDDYGFILLNEYAAGDHAEDLAGRHADQSMDLPSECSAPGCISPRLERRLEELGATVVRPTDDTGAPLQSRIYTLTPLPEVALTFERHFGAPTRTESRCTRSLAREHIRAGRRSEALESYKKCLESSPWDWTLLGEVSEFLNREVRDYTSALAFARAAISLNPITSTWLWNLFGDAFFRLGRWSEAYEAYLRAERIDPNDARTNAGLAESYLQQQQFEDALQAIARGLSRDVEGTYRERLLETQRAVLGGIAARTLQGPAAAPRSYERLPDLASRGTGIESESS